MAVVALLAPATLCLTGTAHADPDYPSAAAVRQSQSVTATAAVAVGVAQARLAAADAALDRFAVEAGRAVEAYNGAVYALDQAHRAERAARARSVQAQRDMAAAKRDIGKLAADTYRLGSIGSWGAVLQASGPGDLIDRAATLSVIAGREQAVFDRLTATRTVAGVLGKQAQAALHARQRAVRAVASAKQEAQRRVDAQQAAVHSLGARRDASLATLAAARRTSVALEQARQAGLGRERMERERAARMAAARRAELARLARERARQQERREAEERRRHAPPSDPGPSRTERRTAPTSPPSDSAASAGASSGTSEGGTGASSGGPFQAGGGSDPGGSSGGPSQSTVSGAAAALAYARAQIGKPYQWGGSGPGAFDCSGLTMRAWGRGGVYLPHQSGLQYRISQKVSINEMRPGDLVFFAEGGAIYHVGLFIGRGQMIEAPYTGADVRISSIWRDSLYGAARP